MSRRGSKKILVMRGGGIGDFILTLPAIEFLRGAFPDSHLEILGYRRVLGLVDGRPYADAVRSIDWAPLAALFNPRAEPDPALSEYLRNFDLILSYLYDPDGLFRTSLEKIGIGRLLQANPHPSGDGHAANFFAAPLIEWGIEVRECRPRVFLSPDIARPLPGPGRWVAMHPGSGGSKKNWPLGHWNQLIHRTLEEGCRVMICGGEADADQMAFLRAQLPDTVFFLEHEPLDVLGASLAQCGLFIGHDTGISHLAAAVGIPTIALFGPTNPDVWAPVGSRVVRAPEGRLSDLEPSRVWDMMREMLP